jgi:hypothetical protein
VLWDNGGEIGYATGETLRLAKLQYETSMKVEAQRKTPARGSRSIPWGLFGVVKYGNGNVPLWLPKSTQSRQAW